MPLPSSAVFKPMRSNTAWEEVSWLSNQTGREGLALELNALRDEGVITQTRALELAGLVLRENAVRLYSAH